MKWDLFTSAEQAAREAPSGKPVPRPERRFAGLETLRAARARPGDEWTVAQVNAAARELIEGVFPPLWVAGEVANFTRARSGHGYFTLRDDESQLRCVMWRDEAVRLPTTPEEGMAVRALGRLTLYPVRGDFQLVVTQLEGRGDGLWKLALERLRRKLEAEGLTAAERKRPLPAHPAVLGVVTSPSGAVLHDILNVVRRRAPWTRVVLAGCRVQGEGAADEIAAAIRLFARSGCADVLIVGRGGGSVEDLWAFNEEVVARAIAESPVPVISAVGHETDVTIADLVADHRASTPSAAAEAAVPDRTVLLRNLGRDLERMERATDDRLAWARDQVAGAAAELTTAVDGVVRDRRDRLRIAARHLAAISPLAAFERGFALPLTGDGTILRRAGDFAPGAAFGLRVVDGTVPCRVEGAAAAGGDGPPPVP